MLAPIAFVLALAGPLSPPPPSLSAQCTPTGCMVCMPPHESGMQQCVVMTPVRMLMCMPEPDHVRMCFVIPNPNPSPSL